MNKASWKHSVTPLPCPFCGKAPKITPSRPDLDGNAWGSVICVNKKCPVMPQCNDGEQCADERGSGAYKDAAIRRWNTRAEIKPSAADAEGS